MHRNATSRWSVASADGGLLELELPVYSRILHDAALSDGRCVVLEIDLQGARQVKRNLPEARLVFLEPPSWEELVERLRGRGTEDEATQARRLETAKRELEAGSEADHRLVNVEIEETVAALVSLLGLACDPLIEGSH